MTGKMQLACKDIQTTSQYHGLLLLFLLESLIGVDRYFTTLTCHVMR